MSIELKNTLNKIKNLSGIHNTIVQTKDRISVLKDRLFENTPSEEKEKRDGKGKKIQKTEGSLWQL